MMYDHSHFTVRKEKIAVDFTEKKLSLRVPAKTVYFSEIIFIYYDLTGKIC